MGSRKGQGAGVTRRPDCVVCGGPVAPPRVVACGPGCAAARLRQQLKGLAARRRAERAAARAKTCKACGGQFPKNRRQEFCSTKCRGDWYAGTAESPQAQAAVVLREWRAALAALPGGIVGGVLTPRARGVRAVSTPPPG